MLNFYTLNLFFHPVLQFITILWEIFKSTGSQKNMMQLSWDPGPEVAWPLMCWHEVPALRRF
jgi:hypothetical protein